MHVRNFRPCLVSNEHRHYHVMTLIALHPHPNTRHAQVRPRAGFQKTWLLQSEDSVSMFAVTVPFVTMTDALCFRAIILREVPNSVIAANPIPVFTPPIKEERSAVTESTISTPKDDLDVVYTRSIFRKDANVSESSYAATCRTRLSTLFWNVWRSSFSPRIPFHIHMITSVNVFTENVFLVSTYTTSRSLCCAVMQHTEHDTTWICASGRSAQLHHLTKHKTLSAKKRVESTYSRRQTLRLCVQLCSRCSWTACLHWYIHRQHF